MSYSADAEAHAEGAERGGERGDKVGLSAQVPFHPFGKRHARVAEDSGRAVGKETGGDPSRPKSSAQRESPCSDTAGWSSPEAEKRRPGLRAAIS